MAYASSAADLNRDGYLDLVFSATREGKSVDAIFWGSADGYSDSNRTTLIPRVKRGSTHAIGDLNRDGYLDLIIDDDYFGDAQIFWGGPKGYSTERSWSGQVGGGSIELADLNGDGYLDFIVTGTFDGKRKSYNTHTRILWGTADGTPSRKNVVELEAYGAIEAAVADFNRDGNLDIALSNYMSDSTRSLPLFIYWGAKGGKYSNRNRTELPAESSAGVQALDLNRDGYPELIIHNHLKDGRHSIHSYIYWNGPQGFDRNRRTELPTFGPHYSQSMDAGNLYTRKLEEEYLSANIAVPRGKLPARLGWKAEEPFGAKLKFQVRYAASEAALAEAKWQGPEGAGSYFLAPGELKPDSGALLMQYRAVFTSPDAAGWPSLSEVNIGLR
ncbi:MAG: VCBS repeat-containing protein [Acidobacteria bacterium]|nr:VCBS repeat-containing protein [Acidobacteriota bacterium]